MDPVIVMVGRANEGVNDIEVMPDIPAEVLADAIAAAFGWDGAYDIQINGKSLGRHQTLADVEAWDGSELQMVVSNRPTRDGPQENIGSNYRILKSRPLTKKDGGQTAGSNQSEKAHDLTAMHHESELNTPDVRWKPVVPEPKTYTLLSSPVARKPSSSAEDSTESDSQ